MPVMRFFLLSAVRRLAVAGAWLLAGAPAWAGPVPSGLPETVSQALQRAGIPDRHVAVAVMDAEPGGRDWIVHNASDAMSPASVMKLVTTFAALDRLGPAFTWHTPVFVDGPVSEGVLHGSLYIRGGGDPSLTSDRLRELLAQVRAAGVRQVAGNIVVDRSVFALPDGDPGAFDGEPLKLYNTRPDALLVNFKALTLTFNPAVAGTAGSIPVALDPPLAGVTADAAVALDAKSPCGDWRKALVADFTNPQVVHFRGSYPLACGLKQWNLAYADPSSYALRAVAGVWQQLGGAVQGQVMAGQTPANATLVAEGESKPLAEVVRDINKYSNNVMARLTLLALALPDEDTLVRPGPMASRVTVEAAQAALLQWWHRRLPGVAEPVVENGSGLSRSESISALALARLLQTAWTSPVMPELVSSLPVAGLDGTMRRSHAVASAHIKTGTLQDVSARAGYVLGADGRRRIMVFMINDPKAGAAVPAFDALIDWCAGL